MVKTSNGSKKILKDLTAQVKKLEDDLIVAKQLEGIDDYITVRVEKDQARFERVKKSGESDIGVGHFFLQIEIGAKSGEVFVPLSMASGKKPTGFIYQIEGTAEGAISSATVTVRGAGVTQITVGTILYAKIPANSKASFRIQATIRGTIGKTYKIILTRINYKTNLKDVRYNQYLKEIISDSVRFS